MLFLQLLYSKNQIDLTCIVTNQGSMLHSFDIFNINGTPKSELLPFDLNPSPETENLMWKLEFKSSIVDSNSRNIELSIQTPGTAKLFEEEILSFSREWKEYLKFTSSWKFYLLNKDLSVGKISMTYSIECKDIKIKYYKLLGLDGGASLLLIENAISRLKVNNIWGTLFNDDIYVAYNYLIKYYSAQ
eukprot:NODE_411_length_9170_cov_0.431154.p5 type:complete len:188 gc:universal NODE_411_length_9170_cov_0.431154:8526-9089(+)